jgi:hypothetical protein
LPINVSESTWSIEDRKLLSIILQKSKKHDSVSSFFFFLKIQLFHRSVTCCFQWASVIEGQEVLDPMMKDKVDKQMMLEKFQAEVINQIFEI